MDNQHKDIETAIKSALEELKENDGCLFDCQIEENPEYDPRKLHEVCINHRLAIYLDNNISDNKEKLFVDIEFNREGVNQKDLKINNETKTVRPDIIVHNRKSDKKKIQSFSSGM